MKKITFLCIFFLIFKEIYPARSGVFKAIEGQCPTGSKVISCSKDDQCNYQWGPDAYCKNGMCYIKEDSCNEDQECMDMLEKK